MASRIPLVAGNWKMNKTLATARELVGGLREGVCDSTTGKSKYNVDVLICPPVHLLFPMAKAVASTPIMMGAQNCHENPSGAFTGEISVEMIKETGATYIIVGHSERRQLFGETGDRLAKKTRAVLGGALTVIYCVGEILAEREAGRTKHVIDRQYDEVITKDLPFDKLVLAYEPVWAIGTGKNATPAQAQEVHRQLRDRLAGTFGGPAAEKTRILYGGSVKPDNSEALFSQPDVDGGLVGGACLVANDFLAIISAAARTAKK